jgi:hypothetical protein
VYKLAAGARQLGELTSQCLSRTLARQGFAAAEIVTCWPDIAGQEVALHSQPVKINWPRGRRADAGEGGTLVLRVEGPAAIEIQHQTGVILERVNRFFGWRAIGRIALRQAPLLQRRRAVPAAPDAAACARVAATLTGFADDELRQALARLGAAVEANNARP